MAGKKSDHGPTGAAVASNVKRIREARNLGYAEMSRRLADVHRDIPPLGLRRIESGERRVDVDDLMALAVTLDVSPIRLLMPPGGTDAYADADATGAGTRPAHELWNWLTAKDPLRGSGRDSVEFWLASWPEWLHPAVAEEVQERVRRFNAELARRRDAKRGAETDGDD
jgi:transcriptional regulator with XRE-family HTH domain